MNIPDLGLSYSIYELIARYLVAVPGADLWLGQKENQVLDYTLFARPVGSSALPTNIGAVPRFGRSFIGYPVEPD